MHWTHLSPGTRESTWVLWGAGWPFCQAEHPLTVPSKIPEGLPCAPPILGALQNHSGWSGRAEYHDQVGEEELRLQVHPEGLFFHPLCGLPPSVGVAERGVAHGRRRVRLAGHSGVALATFCCGTSPPQAGVSSLFVEAEGLGEVGAAHWLGADNSAQSQVAHARVAGSTRATVLLIWTTRTCEEIQ